MHHMRHLDEDDSMNHVWVWLSLIKCVKKHGSLYLLYVDEVWRVVAHDDGVWMISYDVFIIMQWAWTNEWAMNQLSDKLKF